MSLLFYLSIGSLLLVIFVGAVLLGIKRVYDRGEALPKRLSLGFWIMDIVQVLLMIAASVFSVLVLPIDEILGLFSGLALLVGGTMIMFAGMAEFRSIQRVSGLDTSELVTTGIYRWSRNPQYIGWFMILFSITLIGRSGFALIIAMTGIILFHYYTVRMEEPYLQRVYGVEYQVYKFRTSRYIGRPRIQRNPDRSCCV